MKIFMICCPFQTSFGAYTNSLRAAIEKKTGDRVQWVGSNCGCGDQVEVDRKFQIADCRYFELPVVGEFRSDRRWRLWARGLARSTSAYFRARRYAALCNNADIVHFYQILNAYGSKALFRWLSLPSGATRIVTVHELDSDQLASPQANGAYNRADGIIVHCLEMKEHLIRLGVQAERIHIIPHGATLMPLEPNVNREGVVFYAGHKLMSGKGTDTVFKAMAIVRQRMGSDAPILKIHGHYGTNVPAEGMRLAEESGVADLVTWLNQLSDTEICKLYMKSLVCVLPYTGSFAGLAASEAAACALPVVATRKAGLPEHLGDLGIWIEENSPDQLAERIIDLVTKRGLNQELGVKLRRRAEQFLNWDVIADRTLEVYGQARSRRSLYQSRIPVPA